MTTRLSGTARSYGAPMPLTSNSVMLRADPLGSTRNSWATCRGALIASRVLSDTSNWPPVVNDSMRPAMFTLAPTAAYFVRRAEPMLPTMTRPVCTPIPISSSGPAYACRRAFTSAMARCIAIPHATARAA